MAAERSSRSRLPEPKPCSGALRAPQRTAESPAAGLINVNGTLYGTTFYGGARGRGTVFAVTPSGTETVIYSFKADPDDGHYPGDGLINVNGTLYGVTGSGGAYRKGTVFAITASGTEIVLHRFGRPGDGSDPSGALLNVNGTLYGATSDGGVSKNCPIGCGTVFRTHSKAVKPESEEVSPITAFPSIIRCRIG